MQQFNLINFRIKTSTSTSRGAYFVEFNFLITMLRCLYYLAELF